MLVVFLLAKADVPNQSIEIFLKRHQDHFYLQEFFAENITKLTPDQKFAYETITNDIAQRKEELFFLDAPGGTGKTFLTNLLLATV